jgi:hypothetical protein
MDSSNKPHPEVVKAFAVKAKRISKDLERMVRFSREWLPCDDIIKDMWSCQRIMFKIAERLGPDVK